MRSIQVSTGVFAAIWAAHLEGEDSEDVILARLLGARTIKVEQPSETIRKEVSGFSQARYGFHVPEGFEIFRQFKGSEFRAVASKGKWMLKSDGKLYDTLSDLSVAIEAKAENAWVGWLCRQNGGKVVTVGSLRAQETVQKRSR